MSDLLPFVVAGLTAGAVYALAGVGLVLTYNTSRIYNFAHGALATAAAYVFYSLRVQAHWPWPVAAVVAVVALGAVMGLLLEPLARVLRRTPLTERVAATVGAFLAVEAGVQLIYGTTKNRTVPGFLGSQSFVLFGTRVSSQDVAIFGFAVCVTLALAAVLRFTRLGTEMRAVVSDPELLDTAGVSPNAVRRVAWVIGSMLAAASGVLFSALLPLSPVQLTLLVAAAFGATALGAFRSLLLTFAGGLVIGVAEAITSKYITNGPWVGISTAIPFIVLFVVLLLFPRRWAGIQALTLTPYRSQWRAPGSAQALIGVVLLAFFVAVPAFVGVHLTDWTSALANVIAFLGLGLLVRTSGQVSLCQVTFVAVGAAAFSHLTVDHHVPWLLALLITGLIAVPIGAVISVAAIRLPGVYLALLTFGFGILVQYVFYSQSFMFGASDVGLIVPRPKINWLPLATDKGYYYLVLAIAAVVTVLLLALNLNRLGRLLRALGDAPITLATSGTATAVTRVLVFSIAAFLASVAGALTAAAQTVVSPLSYSPLLSITYFTLVVIVVGGDIWFAFVAAIGLFVIPSYWAQENVTIILQLIFGATAVAFAFVPSRARGVPPRLAAWLDRRLPRMRRPMHRRTETPLVPARTRPEFGTDGLEVSGLHVSYGGNVAVADLSLRARCGMITGLIGPNGAGKTTTFNACSGLVRPSAGRILLLGRDVSRWTPAKRARGGLGRTFQRAELYDSMTVRQNVAMGAESARAGTNPVTHFAPRRHDARSIVDATDRALALCGLEAIADQPVADLATGQRRLVDLARCLAGDYKVLLLDEPSAGLDRTETDRFGDVLVRIVDEYGVGILLVEHDISLVMRICQWIYVLDFGQFLFEGTPGDVASSPIVQAAYLGQHGVEAIAAEVGAPDRSAP